MKIERLRNGRYKLIFLCGFILVVILLILSIVFKGSKAKYRNTKVIPLINGKVKNNVPSFTTMGIYLEDANGGEEKNGKKYTKQGDNFILPSSGYVINETNSYCEKYNASQGKSIKDTKAKFYTNNVGEHVLSGISKGDKCYIYLDKLPIKNFLLRAWGYPDTSKITERTDFASTRTDGGNKVYKANDESGQPSYYLVGNPQNNWVKFANLYWRIVRINGDGTLRLIYQGTAANTTGTGTHLQTSAYNSNYNSAEYVGYMWTVGQLRGYGSASTIKGAVDGFYTSKLSSFASYIDKNAGFCNDRSTVTGSGTGTISSNFGAYTRLYSNKAPVLTCASNDDLFTMTGATKGNGKLTYPVGLITADEVAMGGLVFNSAPSSRKVNMYDTGEYYWTMSPFYFFGSNANVWAVHSSGYLDWNYVSDTYGVRPVINLISSLTFTKGDGTSTSPFEI